MEDLNLEELLNSDLFEVDNTSDGNNIPNKHNGRVSKGKIVGCCVLGVFFSFCIFLLVGSLYTKYIRFPAEEEIVYEETGAYAIENYMNTIKSSTSEGNNDYLVKEIDFANSNSTRLDFIKKIIGTVKYTPNVVNAKNVYGNDLVDRDTLDIVTKPSDVKEGEEVAFTFVDYDAIKFDAGSLQNLIIEYDMSSTNVAYSSLLVDMFCDYICSMNKIPTKTIQRAVCMKKDGDKFVVLEDEDIYLDKLLFSSNEFDACKMRFTEAVGSLIFENGLVVNKEWETWSKLSKVKKKDTIEPLKYGKYTMLRDWCGSYYLKNERYIIDDNGNKIKKEVVPELGDGSFKNPASVNTPVITYVIEKDEKGNVIKHPIQVEMIKWGVSEDAIDWFQSKDIKNRGFNLESEVQYCYAVFRVVNLSTKPLTIYDNSNLCDKNINTSIKTGTVFGLQKSITLNPDESGIIETWNRSTELYTKYFIWGSDFDRQQEPVWFRVLAGDLEDTTYNKGVHVINDESDEESVDSEGEVAPALESSGGE